MIIHASLRNAQHEHQNLNYELQLYPKKVKPLESNIKRTLPESRSMEEK